MKEIVPAAKPAAARELVLSYVTEGKQPLPEFPFLVGRRGYFGDSMGLAGENDIGFYDDALWIIEKDRFTPFNANCDPGRKAPHMATLKEGRYWYVEGIHNQSKDPKEHPHYAALTQAGPVTVLREGSAEETGLFGINIHRGGNTVTSSLGCQTIPPIQFGLSEPYVPGNFMYEVRAALVRAGKPAKSKILYILTTRY